jgi:hypothetical protein
MDDSPKDPRSPGRRIKSHPIGESEMNIAKKVSIICAMGVAVVVAASTAWGNNGVQFYEFDSPVPSPGFYVPCLGENIAGVEHITGTYHEVVTPSGTYHLLDNWKFWGEWTGLVTGRTWVSQGLSPYQDNIGPGYAGQWVSKIKYTPLDGDGPIFFWENEFKITVNANGELVVDRSFNPNPEELTRCVGKH